MADLRDSLESPPEDLDDVLGGGTPGPAHGQTDFIELGSLLTLANQTMG